MATRAPRPTAADTQQAFAAVATPAPSPLDVFDPDETPTGMMRGEDPERDAETDLGDRMRAMLAAAPGDRITIKLYRLDRTGQREFCSNYTPEQFESGDLEMIRDDWGAGAFEIRAIGKRGVIMRNNFSIAEKRGTVAVPAFKPENSEFSQMIRLLIDGQTAMLAKLSEKPNEMEGITKMLALAGAMRDAFGPPAGAAVTAAPAVSATAALKEMLEVQALLKNATTESPKGEGDGLMEALTPILDVVSEAMKGNRAPNPVQGLPMIHAPASLNAPNSAPQFPAAPEAGTQNQPEPEMNVFQVAMLRQIVQTLVMMASQNKTAAEGADYILKLPDQVIEFLDVPEWFETLAEAAPAVLPHRVWFEAAHAETLARLDAEDVDPTP